MKSYFKQLSLIDKNILSKNELKIISFIENNIPVICETNMKIEKMSEEIQIGFSAIYSLIEKLNFEGYREFIIALISDYNNSLNFTSDINILNYYLELFNQNSVLIKKKLLLETINLFRQAKNIFVCPWEKKIFEPAINLISFFERKNFNIKLIENYNETWEEIKINFSNQDLIVIYSDRPNINQLNDLIEKLFKIKIKIILISGYTPHKKIVNYVNVSHVLLKEPVTKNKYEITKSTPYNFFNDVYINYYLNEYGEKKELDNG